MLVVLLLLYGSNAAGQTTVKKVILQSFWWDYWNSNYPNSWANYLTELAPRLKQMGIDMVWIPPVSKGGNGTNDVGYGTFDNYDLGDKFQKGNVRTRIGSKDELLRMIAVMHANGIEVMQDVVPNQLGGAGDLSNGGIDPSAAASNKYKNFRYTSFLKPATTQANAADSVTEYLSRDGRFSKNWQNFHDNPAHNGCENNGSDDWCHELFGPDICYYDNAYGQSGNAVYNPVQTGTTGNGYMRKGMRDWLIWLKKQIAFDGIRLDASKHYEYAASEDWLYNLQQQAVFASGTDSMIAVGEYVGNSSQMDNWCNNVQNRAGTFDFNFREGIKSMVDAGGFFDMSTLPGYQQSNRVQYYSGINAYVNRTIPFVNNHDTYRPTYDANGDITGWNTGSELAPHIDPINNTRLTLAYAAMMAIDGNPQVFFEDLFNIGNTGQRFSHQPANAAQLPSRAALENLIACHQKLQFKNGAYKVRSTAAGGNVYFNSGSSAADLLIIERSGKALIGLNDRGDAGGWQSAYVDSDFPPGTVLKDYSGANGTATYTVPSDKRVNVNTPPVDPSNNRWGYSIWAPVGFDAVVYEPHRNKRTTQEWEMANDLGDSHCSSLGYGGAMPANSTNQRVAGKIFAAASQVVNVQVSFAATPSNVLLSIWDVNGNKLAENNGSTPISYTPATDGWLVIKLRNTSTAATAQNVFVKADYQAPATVNTLAAGSSASNTIAIWTGNKNSADVTDCGNWEEGKLPGATTNVLIPAYSSPSPIVNSNLTVNNITIENGASLQVGSGVTLTVKGNWNNNNISALNVCGKIVLSGTTLQQLYGKNNFCELEIGNAAGINAQDNNTILTQLTLTNGKYILNGNNLSLQPGAAISGGSAASYVQSANTVTGGFFIQQITATPKLFPVGNNDYTPLTITNNGTVQNCNVRCFEDVLANGLSGPSLASNEKIKKTWEITPAGTGAVADISFSWNAGNEDILFNRNNCLVAKNTGGAGSNWQSASAQAAATGSGPYTKTATGISSFSKFSIFSSTTPLPVRILSFTAAPVSGKAKLDWKIAADQMPAYFEVQRSNDGTHFLTVGKVTATASSSYSFTDNDFAAGSWYRINVVSNSGSQYLSDAVFVRNGAKPQQFFIGPNPTDNFIRLNATGIVAGEKIGMEFRSAAAAIILQGKADIIGIEQMINAKLSRLSPGIYYLRLQTTSTTQVLKIVKQ